MRYLKGREQFLKQRKNLMSTEQVIIKDTFSHVEKNYELIKEADGYDIGDDISFDQSLLGQMFGWLGRKVTGAVDNKKLKNILDKLKLEMDKILIDKVQDDPEWSVKIKRTKVYSMMAQLLELVNRKKGGDYLNTNDYEVETLTELMDQCNITFTEISQDTDEEVKKIGLDGIAGSFLKRIQEFQAYYEELQKEDFLKQEMGNIDKEGADKYLVQYLTADAESGGEENQQTAGAEASVEQEEATVESLLFEKLILEVSEEEWADKLPKILAAGMGGQTEAEKQSFKNQAKKLIKKFPNLGKNLSPEQKEFISSKEEPQEEEKGEKVGSKHQAGEEVIYKNGKGETRKAKIAGDQDGVVDGSIKVTPPSGNPEYAIWDAQILPKEKFMTFFPGQEIKWKNKKGDDMVGTVSPKQDGLAKGNVHVITPKNKGGFALPISKIINNKGQALPPHMTPLMLTDGDEKGLVKQGEKGLEPIDNKETALAVIKKTETGLMIPPGTPDVEKPVEGGGDVLVLMTKKVNDHEEHKVTNGDIDNNETYNKYHGQAKSELTEEEITQLKGLISEDKELVIEGKNSFNPFQVAKLFKRAQNIFAITRDEYDDMKEKDKKKVGGGALTQRFKSYEPTENKDKYNNKKLYSVWNDGVMDLLSEYNAEFTAGKKVDVPKKAVGANVGNKEEVDFKESKSYFKQALKVYEAGEEVAAPEGEGEVKETKSVKYISSDVAGFIADMLDTSNYDKSAASLIKKYFGITGNIEDGKDGKATKKPEEDTKGKSYTQNDTLSFISKSSDGKPVNMTINNNKIKRNVFGLDIAVGEVEGGGENPLKGKTKLVLFVLDANKGEGRVRFKMNIDGEFGWVDKYTEKSIEESNGFKNTDTSKIYAGFLKSPSSGTIKPGTYNLRFTRVPITDKSEFNSNEKDDIGRVSITINSVYILAGNEDNLQYEFPILKSSDVRTKTDEWIGWDSNAG